MVDRIMQLVDAKTDVQLAEMIGRKKQNIQQFRKIAGSTVTKELLSLVLQTLENNSGPNSHD